MTYDPFQIHSAFGAYPGLTTPFQSPYMQLNPAAAFNPLTTGYLPMTGISPQHLQLAQILAARVAVPPLLGALPWTTGLNNPLLTSAVLQNPLIAATLENPLLNPILAQTQFGVPSYPFNPHMGQTAPQLATTAHRTVRSRAVRPDRLTVRSDPAAARPDRLTLRSDPAAVRT